jgi:hypothetical protein
MHLHSPWSLCCCAIVEWCFPRCDVLREDLTAEEKQANADLALSDEAMVGAISMVESLDNRAVHEFRTSTSPGNDSMVVMAAVVALLSGVMPGVNWNPSATKGEWRGR